VFRLADHVRRFHESARMLRMNLALSEEATAAALLDLLRAEGLRQDCYPARAGFLLRRGDRRSPARPEAGSGAVAVPFGLYIDKPRRALHGLVLAPARRQRHPAARENHGQLRQQRLGQSDAELAGFDEAIPAQPRRTRERRFGREHLSHPPRGRGHAFARSKRSGRHHAPVAHHPAARRSWEWPSRSVRWSAENSTWPTRSS